MCIIMIKDAGAAMPPKERFEGMFERNPDGAGFMYPKGGWVEYKKGFMTFDAFWGAFQAALTAEEQKALPVVCHFRIGTHGDKKAPTHTHPFPLTDNIIDMTKSEGRVSHAIAHNGIFSLPGVGKWKFPTGEKDAKGDDIYVMPSDTMDYVRDIIFPISLKKGWFELKPMHRIIDMTIGYSKLVIMRGDGKILRFGEFVEHRDDHGVVYSNSNYYKTVYYPPEKTYTKDAYAYDWDADDELSYHRSRGKHQRKEGKTKFNDAYFLLPPSARKDGYPFSMFAADSRAIAITSGFVGQGTFASPGDKFQDLFTHDWYWYMPTRDGVITMHKAHNATDNRVWLYEYDADAHAEWFVGAFRYERSKLALSDKIADPTEEAVVETEVPLPEAPKTTEPVA